MRIPKRTRRYLEKRIAALEAEQLELREYIQKNTESNERLIEIVKKLRNELKIIQKL